MSIQMREKKAQLPITKTVHVEALADEEQRDRNILAQRLDQPRTQLARRLLLRQHQLLRDLYDLLALHHVLSRDEPAAGRLKVVGGLALDAERVSGSPPARLSPMVRLQPFTVVHRTTADDRSFC